MIREAEKQDLNSIFELVKVFATSFEPKTEPFTRSFEQILADSSAYVFVAEEDGKIIGYALGFIHSTFFANGNIAWLEEIMVDERFRRTGVGTALVKAFEQAAASVECKLIALATRRADDFYLSIGYEKSATYFRKLL